MAVDLLLPVAAADGLAQPITFTWDAYPGAINYQIQVATDAAFDTIVADETTSNTTIDISGFAPDTEHFWRVRAFLIVTFTLTASDPGNNDAIQCSDVDLSAVINIGNGAASGSATADEDAQITGITAVPAPGREFVNWTGDLSGTENPTTTALVMTEDKSIGAVFQEIASGTVCTGIIGEDGTPASMSNPSTNGFRTITKFALECYGTPATVHAWVGGGFDYELALYQDNGASAPTLIWSSGQVTAGGSGTVDLSVTYDGPELTTNDFIWIGAACDAPTNAAIGRLDHGTAAAGTTLTTNSVDASRPAFPETWVETEDYDAIRCVWIEF
ncbi:hypothetical protein [uncultured Desulfuromusa sp.]|uniref:InlB B-repeat-containing protein n=1 Tax=uncultured Desulfuromusa sp. TaxID=219183 RepID=UPI002AA6761E|nr:hypothetical protein [uncultured Desulfuromusa sp.]